MPHDETSAKVTPEMESAKALAHPKSPGTAVTTTDSPPAEEAAQQLQPFRLLDLPDELWAKIGRMVIEVLPPTRVGRIVRCESDRDVLERRAMLLPNTEVLSSELTPPAILQTCAALRKELRADYYRTKVSIKTSVACTQFELREVGQYLRMMGHFARTQISAVCFDYWVWDSEQPSPRGIPRWGFADWEVEMMLTQHRYPANVTVLSDVLFVDWDIKFL